MRVIGLTGGIATGKSSVATILREALSIPVLDADQASRTILEPGKPAYEKVVEAFGSDILDGSDQIQRRVLRSLILQDPKAKEILERITHPAIRGEIATRLLEIAEEGHSYAVVEAALLVETGSYKQYHELIVVTCDASTQLRRVMIRDQQTAEEAQRIIDAQLPMEAKVAVASVVIHNNGTIRELQQNTVEAWMKLMGSE